MMPKMSVSPEATSARIIPFTRPFRSWTATCSSTLSDPRRGAPPPRRAAPRQGAPAPPDARARGSSNSPGAETQPFRAGRSADLCGRGSPVGAEYALREPPWRQPSRGPAQTAVETTVVLDGEATGSPTGPTNRQPGTAGPGSRAHARAPFSEKAPDFSPGDVYRAPSSRSPVRIRTAVDTGFTKILPSPMLPVLAAAATISTTFETI